MGNGLEVDLVSQWVSKPSSDKQVFREPGEIYLAGNGMLDASQQKLELTLRILGGHFDGRVEKS